MKRSAQIAAALLALFVMPAAAVEKLSGEEIRQLFEGNTVAGRYSNGLPFSEYHHRDGRATGHNRHVPNRDACWTTTQDAVCYYYGSHESRRTYCFTVERSGSLYVLKTVEQGDPENHADRMPAWHCDGLISRGPVTSRRLAQR